MAAPGKKATPAKPAPRKVAASGRGGGRARTAASPAVVEDEAAGQALATVPPPPTLPRPSRSRAAARAAAALRGQDPDATPPDEDDAPVPEANTTAELDFHGRLVTVKMPTSEQLVMYRRLSREFQDLARNGADKIPMDQALRQLDRAIRLIQSVLADQDDKDWVEEQLLEGNLQLSDCTGLLTDAFARLRVAAEEQAATDSNRAERRSAARLG